MIASDWDGYRDTVQHGVTGFLVPTYWADCFEHLRQTPFLRDPIELYKQLGQGTTVDLKILSGHMELLIDDSSLRLSMGEAARRRAVENYDWRVIIQQFEELWLKLMDDAARNQAENRQDDLHFDYLDTFRYHPTRLITASSRVQLSASGLALSYNASIFHVFATTELSAKDEISRRIVAACNPDEQVPVSELVSRLAQEDKERHGYFQQIAQLIKYGILELC